MARTDIKDKRKQQLINATIDSIAKRGLTETTITHISKGAGLSRGIINFYFTSKEMMMRDVLGSLIEQYESVWTASRDAAGESPHAKLEAIVRAHFDTKICSIKRLNVMSAFWGHAATHDAYREKIDVSDSALQAELASLWQQMDASNFNPKQFARQLQAMIRGLWLAFLMAPKGTDRAALAEECLAFIERHQQPLRVVVEQAAKAEEQKAEKPASAKAKPKPKPEPKPEPEAQLDFGDLFARVS
jgi:AcrR family transcriptional regulator